ncbi:MAG: UDP-glucose 4-epimerase GalE [Leptospirales bacterium]|nr:UDP-glucose 4-epimerase GalE [Leptospirales bacterium]
MRVGVTGGAGYIGSHTVLALLEAGHEVVIVDDFSTGDRQNLQPSVTLVEGDFKKPEVIQNFLSHGLDAVFHFAALKAAGESMEQPEAYSAANVRGTLFLIENLSRAKVRNVVFSSSAAVYGEPQYLPVDESHPLVPINYYGFTKLCIEQNLAWFSRLGRIRYASLRYFNAAGYNRAGKIKGLERNTANLLPLVMEAAAGMRPELLVFGDDYQTRDGTGIRDYVHVEDLADAHVRALEFISDNNKDITVNLGSETGMSVMEMIKTTERISGRPVPSRIVARRDGDPPELIASSALAHQLLGWKARYSDADTIISSMWNLYRDKK